MQTRHPSKDLAISVDLPLMSSLQHRWVHLVQGFLDSRVHVISFLDLRCDAPTVFDLYLEETDACIIDSSSEYFLESFRDADA